MLKSFGDVPRARAVADPLMFYYLVEFSDFKKEELDVSSLVLRADCKGSVIG